MAQGFVALLMVAVLGVVVALGGTEESEVVADGSATSENAASLSSKAEDAPASGDGEGAGVEDRSSTSMLDEVAASEISAADASALASALMMPLGDVYGSSEDTTPPEPATSVAVTQEPTTTVAPTTTAPSTTEAPTTTQAPTSVESNVESNAESNAESNEVALATPEQSDTAADPDPSADGGPDGGEVNEVADAGESTPASDGPQATPDADPAAGGEDPAVAIASVDEEVPTTTSSPPATVHPEGWIDAGHGVFLPSVMLKIRWCESRDDYGAANPRSSARGAYQFLTGSWADYGHRDRYGVAQAHLAAPAQQDEAALLTWERSGTRPWNASKHCWG